jgi:integrase
LNGLENTEIKGLFTGVCYNVTVMEAPVSYLAKRASVYYFRRAVPDDLRPVIGKIEIMRSLRTKDREQAKRLIPAEITKSDALFDAARIANAPASIPQPDSDGGRARWENDRWQDTMRNADAERRDWEADELADYEQRLATDPMGKRLLTDHAEELAIARLARVDQNRHAPETQIQAVECSPGKGVYLDTDILDLWAAERNPAEKTKSGYKRVAEWLHDRIGRKSVEQFTRKDMLAFKDRLIADGQTPQNINVKLGNLRTLLQWAADNDYAADNPAKGIILKAEPNKRMPYGLADLRSLFASPIYSEGARPTQGRGEAAYWLPVLALYTGARMEELGQLRISDVQHIEYPDADGETQSCWGLEIIANTDADGLATQIKNKESERFVPLHAELIRLGFLEYVKSVPANGRLFPELRAGAFGRMSAKWGEWYGRYLDSDTKITDKRITFHSFRHTFKDYCRAIEIPEQLQNRLMGHKSPGIAATYGKGFGCHNLVQAMLRYKVPGLTIPEWTKGQHTDTP